MNTAWTFPAFLQQQPRALLEHFTPGRFGTVLLLLFMSWLIIQWMARLLEFLSESAPRARFFFKRLEPVTRIAIWFAAIFVCFDLLAPSRETFFAAMASVGIALGLGAQDLVKNVVGGLVILTDRPYQLGDRVRIGAAYGEIHHIGLRSTKLTTPDDTRVTIPNADVLVEHVYNANSGLLDCQVVTDLYLPPATDAAAALRIGHEAALTCPYLLAKKPIAVQVMDGFSDQPYLKLRIKAYVYDHRHEPAMISDITARAKGELLKQRLLEWRSGEE
ncbi:MAG: mechanosensitive ion channel domain-containing protein [Bryobacteraceae bacterium]